MSKLVHKDDYVLMLQS